MTTITNQSLLFLAIVIIVIGAILLYSPIPYPTGTIGNILIVIGIIVLVYLDRTNGDARNKTYLECIPTCSCFGLHYKITTCVPKKKSKEIVHLNVIFLNYY
jgi:hypothetical protein